MKKIKVLLSCLLLILLLISIATFAKGLPNGVTVFLSNSEGMLYALVDDPLTGWSLLLPFGTKAKHVYTTIEVGRDGQVYACDACGGKILRISYPGWHVETVYDSYAQPASVCTVDVCDPYAGWLNPSDVTFSKEGMLYFVTAGKKCDLESGKSQGVWRILPSAPETIPEKLLDGTVLTEEEPRTGAPIARIRILTEGPLTGSLVITGVLDEHGEARTMISEGPNFSEFALHPASDARGRAALGTDARILILPNGSLIWTSPGDPSFHLYQTSTGAVSDFGSPYALDAVAFDLDRHGYLYILTRGARKNELTILDPAGAVAYRQAIHFDPVAIGVFTEP
jgi:hypothetical protein